MLKRTLWSWTTNALYMVAKDRFHLEVPLPSGWDRAWQLSAFYNDRTKAIEIFGTHIPPNKIETTDISNNGSSGW